MEWADVTVGIFWYQKLWVSYSGHPGMRGSCVPSPVKSSKSPADPTLVALSPPLCRKIATSKPQHIWGRAGGKVGLASKILTDVKKIHAQYATERVHGYLVWITCCKPELHLISLSHLPIHLISFSLFLISSHFISISFKYIFLKSRLSSLVASSVANRQVLGSMPACVAEADL